LSASTAERQPSSFSGENVGGLGPDADPPARPPLGTFSIQELEQAINRARRDNPADGTEGRLSTEVAKLAALYGWMIYEGRQTLSPDLLNSDEMETLSRWL
jgi:Protein of unknown function (DUF3717)